MSDIAIRELKGHDILAVERFRDGTSRMIEFVVRRLGTPYGNPGDEVRRFLCEADYQAALQSQERREIKIKRTAHIIEGHILYLSSTDSIPFRKDAAASPPEPKRRDADMTEIENYRELILDNIEYDLLREEAGPYAGDLDEIVEILVETICAKRRYTRVSGSDFPHEVVKSRLLKLDCEHIRFAMQCMRENTTKIRNIKQYLLAVLFNAPTTIGNYYSALVNHDIYGGS